MATYQLKTPPTVTAIQWDGTNWTAMHAAFGDDVALQDNSNPADLQVSFGNNMLVPGQWVLADNPVVAGASRMMENTPFQAAYTAVP